MIFSPTTTANEISSQGTKQNTTRFKKYILYNLPIIHSTLAILNFTRTLEIIIDFLAVSVVLADIYGMATCRQGIDGVGIRLCKKEISIYVWKIYQIWCR